MTFTDNGYGTITIEPESSDKNDIEIEVLRLEREKRIETDRKLNLLMQQLGITEL